LTLRPEDAPSSDQCHQVDSWPGTRRAWFVVVVLMVLYIFSFVDRMIIALLVAPIKAELNLSDTAIGVLHGLAFALFYTFVGVFLARLADTWNRTKLIAIGVFIWGLATAASGLAGGFMTLFLARVIVGVGEATLSPAAYSMISDYFCPEQRGRAMSVYTSGIYFGVGAALIFGSLVIGLVSGEGAIHIPMFGEASPWRLVFIAVGLPGLALCVFLLVFVREPERREVGNVAPTFAAFRAYFHARQRLYLSHFFGFSFLVMYGYALAAWTPTMLARVHGMTAAEASLQLGVVILLAAPSGVMCGSVLAQRLRQKYGRAAVLRVGMLAAIASVLPAVLYPLTSSPMLVLILIGVTQFCISLPFGVAPAALHEVTPNQYRGQIIAFYLFVINLIGLGVGPLLVGAMTDHVFQNESLIHHSMLALGLVFLPLSALLLSRAAGIFMKYDNDIQSGVTFG
jgi:MFS family permease